MMHCPTFKTLNSSRSICILTSTVLFLQGTGGELGETGQMGLPGDLVSFYGFPLLLKLYLEQFLFFLVKPKAIRNTSEKEGEAGACG